MGYLQAYRTGLHKAWEQTIWNAEDLTDPRLGHFHAACTAKEELIGDILSLNEEAINESGG